MDQLPLEIVGVSRSTVLAAAHVKTRFAISYADAFAVVAAHDRGGVVLTGDPEFGPLAAAGLVTVLRSCGCLDGNLSDSCRR